MADTSSLPPNSTSPGPGRHVFAALAVLALAAAGGFWYLHQKTRDLDLSLGAGMELKYRKGLTDTLCEQGLTKDLRIEIQSNHRSVETIQAVDRHEIDAAIIPAGLAVSGSNLRHVTMLDCEALHLFVKAEIRSQGIEGLRGRTIFLGTPGTGVRCIAEEVLQFMGLKSGKDFTEATLTFEQMKTLPDNQMPDAVFSLSPLPAPMGERFGRQRGYRLLDLPMGEALQLRKPYYESITIPANTYGASPGIPAAALPTVAVRAMLVAHRDTPKAAIERLLAVLYESDFCRNAGLKPLDPALLQRPGEYPAHRGALAYLHRNDPWLVQSLVTRMQGMAASVLSVFSAIVLAWQWIRRRKGDVGEYFRQCRRLDLDAQHAASRGEFGEAELGFCLAQLARLKVEMLERQHGRFWGSDRQISEVVARIEGLQQMLPTLVRTMSPVRRIAMAGNPQRRAA